MPKISNLSALTSLTISESDLLVIVDTSVTTNGTKNITISNIRDSVVPVTVSIGWFGALGNGTTDDSAAIQAAIDSLPSTGGIVIIPPTDNSYLINASIIIPSNVTIKGYGSKSVIKVKSAAALSSYQFGANATTQTVKYAFINENRTGTADENIIFENFYIDCNGDNQSVTESFAGIFLHNASRIKLLNMRIYDAVYGGTIASGYRFWCMCTYSVDDVLIQGGDYMRAGYECIGIRDKSHKVRINGVRIYQGGAHAIQQVGYNYFSTDDDTTVSLSINGCFIEGTSVGNGITTDFGRNVTISGNTIVATKYAVKILNDSQNVTVSGNRIKGSLYLKHNDTGSGGLTCKNVVIEGNNISDETCDAALMGIDVAGCTDLIISNNIIKAVYAGNRGVNVVDQVLTRSENIVISGNKIQCDTTGIKLDNADALYGCRYITMTNNIVSAGNFGIVMANQSDYCIVIGNILIGTGTPLTTVGSNNAVANNIV